ncbi:hypothetical protein [Actinomadura sp. NPDC049753]|uniref:hypothetical protein n=1 Tax=Actinomadura sp. NPDC049753 TaxID=3154739 RepID=UPI00342CCC22
MSDVFGQFGLQVSDTFVEETVVGSGGLELLPQGAVVLSELVDALLERAVLGRDALDGAFCGFAGSVSKSRPTSLAWRLAP